MLAARVLVVDDEPIVRELVCRILACSGLDAVAAADGAEALRHFRTGGPAIDLVISDVQMPGISGIELAHRLRAERPGVSILLISGKVPEEQADFRFPFLPKPFTPNVLLEQVRRLLAGNTWGWGLGGA